MKARLYFEAFSNDKDKLMEVLDKTLYDNVSKFKNFQIIEKKTADLIEKEIKTPDGKTLKGWSSYLELYADFKDFDSLIDFVLFYTPSRIEIEDIKEMRIYTKDEEIKFNKEKINLLLNQISQAIFTKVTALVNTYLVQARNAQAQQGQQKPPTDLKIPKS
ncbi:MAG: hypothetical protein ACP5GJ_03720 [Nanopusillaceae archaeon]|jgi:hypothetical protein